MTLFMDAQGDVWDIWTDGAIQRRQCVNNTNVSPGMAADANRQPLRRLVVTGPVDLDDATGTRNFARIV